MLWLLLMFGCASEPVLLPAADRVNGELRWGLVNGNGTWIVPPTYQYMAPFGEGDVAVAKVDAHSRVLIRRDLSVVALADWDWVGGFIDGRAPARRDGKWGLIDQRGRELLAPKYDRVEVHDGGGARVKLGRTWGFVDRFGSWVAEPRFADAEPMIDGYAQVVEGGRRLWMSSDGQYVEVRSFAR
jgi:trimeric autotransporter adhesin